jgi:hypothetical protein
MAGGGDNSQTNGARDRAMEEGRKDEFAGDRGCGAAISIPFVQKVRHRRDLKKRTRFLASVLLLSFLSL